VIFVFVSETHAHDEAGNVAATDTGTYKSVFLSSHLLLDLKA